MTGWTLAGSITLAALGYLVAMALIVRWVCDLCGFDIMGLIRWVRHH